MAMRIVEKHQLRAIRREATGDRIERLRLERGWTQALLAEYAGITQWTVYRAETGHEMYAWTLAAIAEALDADMDYIWRGEP